MGSHQGFEQSIERPHNELEGLSYVSFSEQGLPLPPSQVGESDLGGLLERLELYSSDGVLDELRAFERSLLPIYSPIRHRSFDLELALSGSSHESEIIVVGQQHTFDLTTPSEMERVAIGLSQARVYQSLVELDPNQVALESVTPESLETTRSSLDDIRRRFETFFPNGMLSEEITRSQALFLSEIGGGMAYVAMNPKAQLQPAMLQESTVLARELFLANHPFSHKALFELREAVAIYLANLFTEAQEPSTGAKERICIVYGAMHKFNEPAVLGYASQLDGIENLNQIDRIQRLWKILDAPADSDSEVFPQLSPVYTLSQNNQEVLSALRGGQDPGLGSSADLLDIYPFESAIEKLKSLQSVSYLCFESLGTTDEQLVALPRLEVKKGQFSGPEDLRQVLRQERLIPIHFKGQLLHISGDSFVLRANYSEVSEYEIEAAIKNDLELRKEVLHSRWPPEISAYFSASTVNAIAFGDPVNEMIEILYREKKGPFAMSSW